MKSSKTSKTFAVLGLAVLMIAPIGKAAAELSEPVEARALFSDALAAHEAGDNAKAITLLKSANAKRPNHPATLSVRAQLEALNGDSTAALVTLSNLADLHVTPGNIAANENYAALLGDPRFEALAARFEANAAPIGTATRFAVATEKYPLVESLAYDAEMDTLFLGLMAGRKIVKRSGGGTWETFAAAEPHGLYSVAGMKIDVKEGLLWAASPATEVTPNLEEGEEGASAVFGFDIDTGELKHKAVLNDGTPHWFGDLIILENGNLILSDSLTTTLYLFDKTANVLLPYITNESFVSAQGLVMGADGSTLFLADYATGLFAIDLVDEKVTALEPGPGVVPYGIDGLYRKGTNLIAVQNGTRPKRIVEIAVDLEKKRLTSSRVLVQEHPDHFEPTLGEVVGDKFLYVANSGWPLFASGGNPAEEDLPLTVILSTDL